MDNNLTVVRGYGILYYSYFTELLMIDRCRHLANVDKARLRYSNIATKYIRRGRVSVYAKGVVLCAIK